ncbi:MAG: DUF2179 domain-containing protein [Bacteroidales bacterium]|nr:DUF2179 domain-containing protein [Bacteroidales bacterium]
MNSIDWWGIIILPLLIFLARVTDVTIGTIRIIAVSKGQRSLAPLLGFFEILIWITAMGEIMQHLDRWYYYLFYAAGFATGNYFGIKLEAKLAMGHVDLRLITRKSADELIEAVEGRGFGLTYVPAHGSTGEVHIIYITVKRSELPILQKLIHEFNPRAFYTIEDMKLVKDGIRPRTIHGHVLRKRRKGK